MAQAGRGDRRACGVGAGRTMHSAPRMGRRRGQEEPADRRSGPAEARDGAEDELLVERRGAPVDGASDEVLVALLQVDGSQHTSRPDPGAEAGRIRLQACLHTVGHAFGVVVVPHTSDAPVPGVAVDLLRHVRVRPQRLGARR